MKSTTLTLLTPLSFPAALRMLVIGILVSATAAIAQVPPAQTPKPETNVPATAAPADTPSAAPAPTKTYRAGLVKIGEEMKETLGRVTDLDKADNGCFLILRNDKNGELIELGKMEFCTQKPSLKGKNVELEYRLETVQASTCYGDPKCKKTETLPYVVSVKVLE